MEFCQKCGSVLIEKNKKYRCAKCNFSPKGHVKIEATEKLEKSQKIGVLKDKESNVFPVISAVCSKCGNREAYFWIVQMRAGDEAETRFFRCTKCSHTWRESR